MLSLSAAALGAWKIIIISYRRTCLVFNLGNLTYCLSQSQAYNSQDFSSHYFCQNTNQQNCPLVPTQKFTSRTSMSHQTDSEIWTKCGEYTFSVTYTAYLCLKCSPFARPFDHSIDELTYFSTLESALFWVHRREQSCTYDLFISEPVLREHTYNKH